MNEFQITGRLGGNPRSFAERAVSISLASSRRFKRDNERVEVTDWNDVVIFDKLAQIALDYLQKGDLVLVKGQVRRNKYVKDGQPVFSTDLIARNIEFLNVRGKNGGYNGGGNAGPPNGYGPGTPPNGGGNGSPPSGGNGSGVSPAEKGTPDDDIPY